MTSTPSDEPTVPGDSTPAPPPPPPAPSGYEVPPVTGSVPPPAYGTTPPGGYAPPPPAYGAQPGYGAPVGAPMSDADQRLWATLAHIGGILFLFIAPLVVWLVQKDRGRFVEEQAKEALNFQILITIAYVVGVMTSWFGIGLVIMFAAWAVGVVFSIMAAIATNKGEAYRYPVSLRLVK